MRISFIINEPIRLASGGYKIIYQYANYLSKKHQVFIYYRCRKEILYSNYKLPFFVKILIAKCCINIGVNWFDLDKSIKNKIITSISNYSIADGDIVFATAVSTADDVSSLSPSKGQKFYFIQHFEDWVFDEKKVKETYSLGMNNIVIAKWLKEIVDKESKKESIYIPNGIDKKVYYIKKSIDCRKPASVAMLYHSQVWKGSQDAIQILKRVKMKYNQLHVEMFGIPEKPADLPDWITYTQNATEKELLEIYNNSAIFLCTSWSEGFGLTGAESMFCGCALITTDTMGVREYANENNSIICKPKDIDALTNAVCRLIEDDNLRIQIAKRGHDTVLNQLDYNKACEAFERAIID